MFKVTYIRHGRLYTLAVPSELTALSLYATIPLRYLPRLWKKTANGTARLYFS